MNVDFSNPHQHDTKLQFKKQTDFYAQRFIKFSGIAEFHSKAELLHAALLESAPAVTHFVPQPYRIALQRSHYVPDCYVIEGGNRTLIEIRPAHKVEQTLEELALLKDVCTLNRIEFKVISNESIYEQRVKADNWLKIVRFLCHWQDVPSSHQESEMYQKLFTQQAEELGNLIFHHHSNESVLLQLAIFRLAHRGVVSLSDTSSTLSYSTKVSLSE